MRPKGTTPAVTLSAVCFAWATLSLYSADYTWMSSPADANWNTSALNWNAGAAWVDGNDAIFPVTSSQKKITLSAMRTVNNVTVNGTGYNFSGSLMKVNGKFTVNFTASGQGCTLADGFGGDSVRIGGNSSGTLYMGWGKTPTVKTIYLEDNVVVAPNDSRCFGPAPSTPSTNIVISGAPSIYANGNLNFAPHRIIRIESGKTLKLGAAGDKTFTLGPIAADSSTGQAYSTNTFVYLPSYWSGQIKFNPGVGVTNDLGWLEVDSRLEVASGVTRVASQNGFTVGCGVNSPLYIVGNSSSYSATRGNVTVSGGELCLPQSSRYVEMSKYAQMTITDGGRVYAPGIHWLMGMTGTGGAMLSVSNNGEFAVGTLRLGQGANWPNTFNLGKNGTIRAGLLTLEFNNGQNVMFNFDGGRVQSNASDDSYGTFFASQTSEKWQGVHFYVRDGGAVLDSTNGKHLWWARPLESGAVHDGGLTCFVGSGKSVVLCGKAVCTYNGPTRVEGTGVLQVRVANALPAMTIVQIAPNSQIGFSSAWSNSTHIDQTVARVEGAGTVSYCSKLVVTGGVSPVFDGTYGTLQFGNPCSLSGTCDIVGDANGCGCLKVAKGQDISGLTLTLADVGALDENAGAGTYKILDAPDGFTGLFAKAAGWPGNWGVKYASDGKSAYLRYLRGTKIVFR